MLESLLVADRGLGAARVLLTCRRLGLKSVLAKLSADGDQVATDAGPLADDVVLLADLAELSDPVAVVRAARAAGVQAVHPGYGPLRGDARLAAAAADAGLLAVVSTGAGAVDEIAAALGAHRPPVRFAGAGERPTRWVYVLGTPTAVIVLGSVCLDATGRTIAGEAARDEAAARRLAHAAAAVLGLVGLTAIGVGPTGVTAVVPGLPEHHAAWELVTGLDLVEQQLLLATGRLRLSATADIPVTGVAIARAEAEFVTDVRALDEIATPNALARNERPRYEEVLRVDAVALAGSTHGALARVSAWGTDRDAAERLLARYVERTVRPA